MKRVAHIPYTFGPDPVGGTEIYVEALARDLCSHGIEPLIVAPASTEVDQAYEHKGLRVRRFRAASASKDMLRELYGAGDPTAAAGFARILDEERPDAVHLHAFTRAISLLLVRAAKERGLPVFFTYHTPTVSCQRGTLMLWGNEICDGVLTVRRCASCSLEGVGIPRWAALSMGHVPYAFSRTLENVNLNGGIWTALRMPELVRLRHEAFYALMREVDGVVALNDWVQTLLIRNCIPASKITLSRHGLPDQLNTREPAIDVAKMPLRVAFLGRADPGKGADTLIKAVRALPAGTIELDLYGVTQSAADEKCWAMLRSLAANDPRISIHPPVPHDRVISLLRGYHILAVPSRLLETGPLVILESLAAGTPVIGSKLGGIAEMVRHGDNGLLVEPENVQRWADALRKCAEDRRLLAEMRKGTAVSRSMADIAAQMALLYCGRFRYAEPPCSS